MDQSTVGFECPWTSASFLQGLALKPEATAAAMKRLGAEHIVEVFERLLAHGFKEHQIRRALQVVPQHHCPKRGQDRLAAHCPAG